MRYLYSILFSILLPFIFIKLWRRGSAQAAYRKRWRERLGLAKFESSAVPRLWFHTVSVGEFIATRPLIERFLKDGHYRILITTMTPTGSEQVIATFGEQVDHCYLPYDLPIFIATLISRAQPRMLISMETEIWPNLFHICKQKDIPVLLANARLSEKSARGYRKLASLTRQTLDTLSAGIIQSEADASRFRELGLAREKITVSGNIKFDLDISDDTRDAAQKLKATLSDKESRPVFIAASTHKGEDEQILDAYRKLKQTHSELTLILVPRHPERFESVATLCEAEGWQIGRRSQKHEQPCDILLGDTMGELLTLLGAADVAFIGGSLVENGGHNYIEPAAWGLPILTGPSYFNFAEVMTLLQSREAIDIVNDSDELAQRMDAFLLDPTRAREQGARALHVAEFNRGATERLVKVIKSELSKT